jgi:hypothetical protein
MKGMLHKPALPVVGTQHFERFASLPVLTLFRSRPHPYDQRTCLVRVPVTGPAAHRQLRGAQQWTHSRRHPGHCVWVRVSVPGHGDF